MSLQNKTTLGDTVPIRLHWRRTTDISVHGLKGDSNDSLYVVCLSNEGRNEISRKQLGETTPAAPSIVTHGDDLFVAGNGDGNDNCNVAQLDLVGTEAGGNVTGYIRTNLLDSQLSDLDFLVK